MIPLSQRSLLRTALEQDALTRQDRQNQALREFQLAQQELQTGADVRRDVAGIEAGARRDVAGIQAQGTPYDQARASLVQQESSPLAQMVNMGARLTESPDASIRQRGIEMLTQGMAGLEQSQAAPAPTVSGLFDGGSIRAGQGRLPAEMAEAPRVNMNVASQTVPEASKVDTKRRAVQTSRERAAVAPIEQQFQADVAEAGFDEAQRQKAMDFVQMVMNGQMSIGSPVLEAALKDSETSTPSGSPTLKTLTKELFQERVKRIQDHRAGQRDAGLIGHARQRGIHPHVYENLGAGLSPQGLRRKRELIEAGQWRR